MQKLEIPKNIFNQIIRQAKEEAPIEACGILAGRNGKAEQIFKMTNADKSNDHFMMIPEEQFKVIKDVRNAGLQILAIYHSHPETPARPSQEDIRLALTPGVVYVIVSLKDENNPVIKGYLIDNSIPEEISVKIAKS